MMIGRIHIGVKNGRQKETSKSIDGQEKSHGMGGNVGYRCV